MEIKKSLSSPRTKVRGLFGLLDARSVPHTKVRGFQTLRHENSVTGHKNQELISIESDDKILKLNVVYAISCRSAKNLGRKCIEKGTKCYVGYEDDFIFVYEKEKISRPLSDETAKLFLEPSKLFIEAVIKSNSVKEALERSKKKIQENFIKTLSGKEQETTMARYLWWNARNFTFLGNQEAKIIN